MRGRLTAADVAEVAEWVRRWRGLDLPVTVEAGPVIVLYQGNGRLLEFGADAIRRLVPVRKR
ncbi:hypothetical protein Ssi03_50740 [Sphaerisporangium siamense]|uniref:Uncharacterized protein n=1 Tax=Sphaerisporangium siamense TaxID=795645 RepID=A0A7W7D8K5_9ACTN|nr:hypothetical protein [Sphaerisporangium siamense]MBB4702222.1 hypothetical protein [Sphaerisporangium siamense]GII87084.1 hypothetical protein Ssi03_50740 [Sphaerisporangium siamense]